MGVGAWLLNIISMAMLDYRRLICTFRHGGTTIASSLGQKPEVKFDLEAGEPLLEDEDNEDNIDYRAQNRARMCSVGLRGLTTILGLVSFTCSIFIWRLVQYQETSDLVDECGSFVYGLAYWLIW